MCESEREVREIESLCERKRVRDVYIERVCVCESEREVREIERVTER